MTISTELRKAGPFTGNGVTTAFPFSFKVFAATDVAVTVANTQGNESALALGADYAVALNADQDAAPGGTVTLAAPLSTGYLLVVSSAVPNLQPTDITNNGGFYPRVIEDALDRHVAQVQQIDEKVGRALKVAITSPLGDQALPSPVAGMLIGWNESSDGLKNYAPIGGTLLGQQLAAANGSSLVGFQQAGTGAVVRTAQDKMREWVSVKDFGAVGDGSDATTAFAAALAAHDNIYVPAGTYAVTGITMSNNKVLFGDGEESVINCSGPINFTDARKGGMRNLRVNLTSASTTLVRLQKGVGVGSFELYFEDVNFVGNIANASTVGIHITDSYINTFVNCLFIDFDKAIIHGVEANRNNYFGCSIRARTTYGTVLIEQTAGQANSFVGCDIENCNRMLDLSGGSIFFDSGCYFEAHNDSFGFKLTGGHVGIDHCYFNEVFIDIQANGSLEFSKNWVKASSLSNATYPVIRVRPNFSRLILDNNILEGATYLCRMNPTRYDYLQQYDSGTGNYVNAYPSNSQHLAINDMIYDVDAAAIRQCQVNNVRAVRSRSEYYSEGRVRVDGTDGLQLVASNWNYNPLRIGANYLWVDATGKLRIKNGAPAFDTDGTVVGTQT